MDSNGNWCSWSDNLPRLILDHFKALFSSMSLDFSAFRPFIPTKVIPTQNILLLRDFTVVEIRDAIFAMEPDKSPGLDCFNPGFFQSSWSIVGSEVTAAYLDMLNNAHIPKDDIFLFYHADEWEYMLIKEILGCFEKASCLSVNFQKSYLYFSNNTSSSEQANACYLLGMRLGDGGRSYLGLPMSINRNKTEVFEYIKERIHQHIFGWNKRFLSRAGKEIILKSIVQALPSYDMSVFPLPLSLCQDLERLMNAY